MAVKKEVMKRVRYEKDTPGEEYFSYQKLLVIDMARQNDPIRKKKKLTKMKMWRLKKVK